MIGPPSSGAASGMSNHDGGEKAVRLKRRTFEELDIENICEELCHNAKKRNTLERDPLEMALADIVHASSSSLSSTSSSLSQFPLVDSSTQEQITDSSGGAALARLEVLVVDGSWDVTNFGESDLIDLSTSATDETSVEHLTNIDSSVNGYSTVLSYWESPTPQQAIQNGMDQCKNIVQNSEPPQSSVPVVPVATSIDQQDDHEHGNLSWLLDFKLDSLIEAPEEKTNVSCACHNQPVLKSRQQHMTRTDNTSPYMNTNAASCGSDNMDETIVQREKQLNSTYRLSDNRNYSSSHYDGPKKPPFTYTELIEHALQERGELTVSAIYQWISEHFPYYKSNDDRWKNSVRHNLSINPHFRKGSKAPHGAGHLWAIANRNETRPRQLIANIPALSTTTQRPTIVNSTLEKSHAEKYSNATRQSVALDEVAAATASISDASEENILTSISLEHCAEQILSGIKREVEVQYLLPMAVQDSCDLESNQQIEQNEQTCEDKDAERECWNVLADFLNPVAKEVVAEECGLIGEGYLVTDLNPTTLGLNIVEPEIITSDHLFGEELSFQFYELASPSQLQSA